MNDTLDENVKPLQPGTVDTSVYIDEPGSTVNENKEQPIDSKTVVNKSDEIVKVLPEPVDTFTVEAAFTGETVWDNAKDTVPMPSVLRAIANARLEDSPNVSLTDSPKLREWAASFAGGLQTAAYGDNYLGTILKKDADWRQAIVGPNGAIAGAHPKFRSTGDNKVLTGDRGVMRFQNYLGLGTVFTIPLWHSGFHLSVRAPSEGALLELNRQIVQDKIAFGRATYGLFFSNDQSYTNDRIINFILANVYEMSMSGVDDPRKFISIHDIPSLVWGLACVIYPRGFQYTRSCIADLDKCTNVDKGRLDLSKLMFTNRKSLSELQIAHMAKRAGNSMTPESVKKYREELLDCQNKEIIIGEDGDKPFKVILKVPTVEEYINSGHSWIGDITTMVNKALGVEADELSRNQYILKQGQATSMRQYVHWVQSIEFNGDLVDERETLSLIFDTISQDPDIRNEFMTKTKKYIDDTAIVVHGIPAYDCPVCGTPQENKALKQTSVIPIDPYQTFFTLLVQKLERLPER